MSSAGADNEAKEKEPLASPGVFSPPVRANSSYTRTAYEKFDPTLYKRICYDGKLSTRLVGAISLLVFWGTWLFGCFSPFWYGWLLLKGYYRAAFVIGLILAYPFIFEVKQSPAFVRFILAGSGWWHGGTTLLMEESMKKVDTSSRTLLAMHPHGILTFGFVLNGGASRVYARKPEVYCPPAFQHLKPASTGLVEPNLFKIPLIRHFLLAFGCADPASKKRMKELFEQGRSVGLLPGGSDEIIISQHGRERIYIKNRKGFIKYALQYGYTIVVGYTFGESDSYKTIQAGWRWRLNFLHKTKVPLFFAWGIWWCPWLPRLGLPLETVIGNPIVLPKIPQPSREEVDHWHQVYVDKLIDIFERNKANFGYANRKLELF